MFIGEGPLSAIPTKLHVISFAQNTCVKQLGNPLLALARDFEMK
jgi:hypothetical protein